MRRIVLMGVLCAFAFTASGCTRESPEAPHPSPVPSEQGSEQRPKAADLQARVDIPSTRMRSGSSTVAHVVVTNGTGRALVGDGCGSPFALVLGNDEIKPEVGWTLCLQRLRIPVGTSTWRVVVGASYSTCNAGDGGPRCVRGVPPGLPPGTYRLTLAQNPHFVPAPAPIRVRVTP